VAQGLVDQVKWGSSTPIANTFMAGQETAFDGKMYINSELALLNSKGPDETLYGQINAKYSPKIAIQSFGQFGYLAGKFATAALLSIKGPVTAKSYNLAVRGLKDQKTDMLCKPWYVGNALPYHIPNNVDITVDYKGGQVVQKQGCFAIAAVDPQITQTRVWEKKYHLQG
jgi:branched-chain amino acid transport system substrate-binding protein